MRNINYAQLTETVDQILKRKDPYDYHHQYNVSRVCVAIGKLMNSFTPHEMEMLKWGAALHDMGKIFIEDTLLNFPRKLSAAERVRMELHTVLGCDPIIIDIAHHHHCNMDGSGYPRSRSDCSPFSRIVRVVDTYDAMTNERVYKFPASHADAMMLLEAEAGRIFDPLIVQLLPFALIELGNEEIQP
jgi:HD-GYP domain-containing protein (c-di-GMP phosphodiesterase class II)